MDFDVVVIGAGPSGLMAAKTAAEQGLSVLLVELKREIEKNLRLCASVLYVKPGFHGDSEVLEDNRLVFVENDFAVTYSGGYEPIYEWFYLSPGGNRFRMGKKHAPAAVAIDKSNLIRHLVDGALEAGVTLWTESAAMGVENTQSGVSVVIRKQRDDPIVVEAQKCIVSDGICSMVTQLSFPQVWQARTHLASACGVGYMVEGLESPWGENHWALCKNRFGSAYFLPTPMKSQRGKKIWKVLGFSTDPNEKQQKARQALDCLMQEAPTAHIFNAVTILCREGCAWDFYTPIKEPAQGHTLLVGDVCAMQEVDIQGALCCGFRAGHALGQELAGNGGFEAYSRWWRRAFEFNRSDDPMKHLAKGFGLFALGAEVLDYWFSLTEHHVMNAFIDHNRLGELLENGFTRVRKVIENERPEVARTLIDYFGIDAKQAYKGYSRDGQ